MPIKIPRTLTENNYAGMKSLIICPSNTSKNRKNINVTLLPLFPKLNNCAYRKVEK